MYFTCTSLYVHVLYVAVHICRCSMIGMCLLGTAVLIHVLNVNVYKYMYMYAVLVHEIHVYYINVL